MHTYSYMHAICYMHLIHLIMLAMLPMSLMSYTIMMVCMITPFLTLLFQQLLMHHTNHTRSLPALLLPVLLFTPCRPMSFFNACLAMTLFLVMSVMVPQDSHLGSKTLASCLVVGAAVTGAVVAGGMVSAAGQQ